MRRRGTRRRSSRRGRFPSRFSPPSAPQVRARVLGLMGGAMRALRFFRKRSPRFFFLLRIKGDLKQAKQKDFVPAKLTTADDDAGNLQSLNRKLTQRLYLTVRRGPKAWLFPQRVTPDSETMRQEEEKGG
mmetsp:Transcript_179/g.496  ORF Transcript_179/g.496 Transcript_179/m.496 type:complete len:130 (+) Transcript_179:301-690(+)